MGDYIKIDAKYLFKGFGKEENGFHADFYEDGQLKTFAYYRNSVPVGWVLTLSHGIEEANCFYKKNIEENGDVVFYNKGNYIIFNGKSDELLHEMKWEDFIKREIKKIYRGS